MRMRGLHFCLLTVASVLAVSGCGGGPGNRSLAAIKDASGGASSPESAVSQFVSATGTPPQSDSKLEQACRLLSPDIREGLEFQPSVRAGQQACGPVLALMVYYTGETSDVRPPSSFAGKVTGVAPSGDEAVVNVTVTYQLDGGSRSYSTKVLAVRRAGQWWVATPSTLNVTKAMSGVTDAQLNELYRQELAATETVHRRHEEGSRASNVVSEGLDPCPTDHASAASDARGDVRLSDGMMLAPQQPGEADLVAVRHNGDGDHLCFELQFAGEPPREGSLELGLRPGGGRVTVIWTGDGRIVGQAGTEEQPEAVEVQASRNGNSMTLRVPRAAFGDVGDTYRWAVELFVAIPSSHQAYVDLVPDDQTINPDGNGGYTDHYIPHPGS